MKNLLNLGKALNKAEQKEVLGGDFGDTGLPDVGPNGPCITYGVGSDACICYGQGGSWNYECNRCDIGTYFAVGCEQIPLSGGFPRDL